MVLYIYGIIYIYIYDIIYIYICNIDYNIIYKKHNIKYDNII